MGITYYLVMCLEVIFNGGFRGHPKREEEEERIFQILIIA